MELIHYKLFCLYYPGLNGYISNCYQRGSSEELLDFIFALETSAAFDRGH